MAVFELVLALLLGGVSLALLAPRLGVPWPALLALAGTALAFVPGVPEAALEPELALALFVAPVLLDAAYNASPRALRDNWAPVGGLVLGAVGLTVATVAGVARWLEPFLPWAAAVALGAIVAPPDAAAATAVLRQVRLPHRMMVILQGESLLNDASALLIYRLAVGAAAGGVTAWTVPLLVIAAVGGAALGVVLAKGCLAVIARVEDTAASVVLQFLTTFGVWLLADALGLSAVLTMVAYAVTLARTTPGRMGARHRRASAVWEEAVFVLNVLAFILVGLQLRGILGRVDGQAGRYALFALDVLAAAVLVRIVWMMGYYAAVRWKHRRFGVRTRRPMPPPSAGGHCDLLVRDARHRHAGCGTGPARGLPGARPGPVRLVLRRAGHPGDAGPDAPPLAVPLGPAAGRERGGGSGPGPGRGRAPRSKPWHRAQVRTGTARRGTFCSGNTRLGWTRVHDLATGLRPPLVWEHCGVGRWRPNGPASRRYAGRSASATTPSTRSKKIWTGRRPRRTGLAAEARCAGSVFDQSTLFLSRTSRFAALSTWPPTSSTVFVSGFKTSLAASTMEHALTTSFGPARSSGLPRASSRRALRRSATTWLGVLPSRTRCRRAL